jgi:hypothetical protein
MAVFVPTILGLWWDLHGLWHSVHVWEAWPKLVVFAFLAVSWAIAHSLGFLGWFTRPMTLSICLRGMTKNSSFLHWWTFLWAIAHYFGVLGRFRRNLTIYTCLRGMTKNSFSCGDLHFRSIFVSYCPQFWVSAVIYKAHDTQSMSMRHDQKLVVFMFSGHFCELLSTVLGF